MSALDLLASANDLVQAGTDRLRQSNLSKAISHAYYAMFHRLAESNANVLVGRRAGAGVPGGGIAAGALERGAAASAMRFCCTSCADTGGGWE